MKQIELRLIPAPGQKPEFLATLELVQKNIVHPLWEQLSSVVVLEGYTRDAWAMDTSTKWTHWQVESVDGRNKLPGFVKYLRDRQKTAYGRFGGSMVLVISHKQMSSSTLNCRIAALNKIPDCPLKPKTNENVQAPPNKAPPPASAKPAPMPAPTAAPASTAPKRKGFGLLGNLVGAQRRTNEQVQLAATAVPKKALPTADESSSALDASQTSARGAPPLASSSSSGSSTKAVEGTKTAGQVLAEFRQEMEQQMLDFDISEQPCLKVKIDLAGKMRLLLDDEKQSGRVTMEVLKYIVYEQAEEVNEEWIAHKEPSEFMDEAVIAIYKEGEAPPEVLEDINKGELPDEIRGQQRAIQEQRQKAEQLKAQRLRMEQMKLALQAKQRKQQQDQRQGGTGEEDDEDVDDDDDDFAALNTKKRDRRTIEDYEREAKRRRGE